MSTLDTPPLNRHMLGSHMLQLAMDHLPQAIFWKDRDLVYLGCNQRFAQDAMFNTSVDIIGKTDYEMPWTDQADLYRADDQQVIDTNMPKLHFEEPQSRPDGTISWLRTSKIPLLDTDGAVIGILGIYADITAQKQIETERARLQEQIIHAQQAALAELSTPLIPISDDVVVMPLIGMLDSRRAQQVMETVLEGIAMSHAHVAIIDITGVAVVDTQVANALMRAAQAVKLLGAQVILTGIRPEVAQTLVGLGVDLNGIVTQASLQSGIAFAMSQVQRLQTHTLRGIAND